MCISQGFSVKAIRLVDFDWGPSGHAPSIDRNRDCIAMSFRVTRLEFSLVTIFRSLPFLGIIPKDFSPNMKLPNHCIKRRIVRVLVDANNQMP